MSAVRCPTVLKTSTFSIKDCENTFNMSAITWIAPQRYKNISETDNTRGVIVRVEYKKIRDSSATANSHRKCLDIFSRAPSLTRIVKKQGYLCAKER